jgi:hypothetical protein
LLGTLQITAGQGHGQGEFKLFKLVFPFRRAATGLATGMG